jgi:hypothetical protein
MQNTKKGDSFITEKSLQHLIEYARRANVKIEHKLSILVNLADCESKRVYEVIIKEKPLKEKPK